MTTVFISYSRDNLEKVKTLVHDLGILGHEPWFDQELAGGQSWWDHITSKIRESELFVYVLSLESLDSHACKSEFMYAKQLGKNILPVLVDQQVDIRLLPPGLAQIHFVDYRTDDKAALGALARAITTLPIASAMPDPLPEPPPVPVSYLSDLIEQINTMEQLSFQDQTGIYLNLKKGLSAPKDKERIVALLKKLRSRKDLFAAVAEEIDALLLQSDKTTFSNDQIHEKKSNERSEPLNYKIKENYSYAFKLLVSVLNFLGIKSAWMTGLFHIEQEIIITQACLLTSFLIGLFSESFKSNNMEFLIYPWVVFFIVGAWSVTEILNASFRMRFKLGFIFGVIQFIMLFSIMGLPIFFQISSVAVSIGLSIRTIKSFRTNFLKSNLI